jgi:hypothetical protein
MHAGLGFPAPHPKLLSVSGILLTVNQSFPVADCPAAAAALGGGCPCLLSVSSGHRRIKRVRLSVAALLVRSNDTAPACGVRAPDLHGSHQYKQMVWYGWNRHLDLLLPHQILSVFACVMALWANPKKRMGYRSTCTPLENVVMVDSNSNCNARTHTYSFFWAQTSITKIASALARK